MSKATRADVARKKAPRRAPIQLSQDEVEALTAGVGRAQRDLARRLESDLSDYQARTAEGERKREKGSPGRVTRAQLAAIKGSGEAPSQLFKAPRTARAGRAAAARAPDRPQKGSPQQTPP